LQEAFPDNNFGDGTTFQAGGRRQGGRTRGLLRFDLAGNVPAGSTITSVAVNLTVTAVPSGGINSLFDLKRLLASWGEGNGSDHGGSPGAAGQATWNNRLGSGTPWTTPGGDFSATVSASRAITGFGSYTFSSTANLVADAQFWLTNPANNFGWILISESESTPTSIRRFGSRDDSANAPTLTINYTAPAPASPPTLFGSTIIGNNFRFSFDTESNRTYAVELSTSLRPTNWMVLTNLSAQPTNSTIHFTNAISLGEHYFRARTP